VKNKIFQKLYKFLVWAFGMESEIIDVLNRARGEITGLRADKEKLEKQVVLHDRGTSLDVRSSLAAIDLDSLGEIIWITVGDERMLRADVFNQIRDYYNTHGKGHSILLVTGPNVTFKSLTDGDLEEAGLRRLSRLERIGLR